MPLLTSSSPLFPSLWGEMYNDRFLQFQLPDYTSPPLLDALEATPEDFRNDTVIDAMRDRAANGTCTPTDCHIPFEATDMGAEFEKLGILFYGGALVDPRAYSVLAEPLAEMGLTTLIPVFENDVALGFPCGTGRIQLAQEAHPEIDQWILVGHSLGGVGASSDAWVQLEMEEDGSDSSSSSVIAGLVLLAADVQSDVCGAMEMIDFSLTGVPMGAVTATEDLIINFTRWEENTVFLSNQTIFESIEGGNHGQFGSYNDTLRTPILGQVDGEATISPQEQWDATIDVILQVAMMATDGSGGDTPTASPTTSEMTETMAPTTSGSTNSLASNWAPAVLALSLFLSRV
ncbi:MAG: hypothetical protein SGILL_004021 [Bacillariaceae sp.]